MDIARVRHALTQLADSFKRIPHLPKLDPNSKLVSQIAQYGLALGLACWAYSRTEDASVRQYIQSHLPPPGWLKRFPETLGYHRIHDPIQIRKVYRNLPSKSPQLQSILVDPSGDFLVLWDPDPSQLNPILMTRLAQEKPLESSDWKPFSTDWNGLRELILWVERLPKPPEKAAILPRRKIDPRELVY